MTMTDPISDYLTRLRNALKAEKRTVDIPASNFKKELSEILKQNGYITDYKVSETDNHQGLINVRLKYSDGKPVISGLRRISKPGIRRYVNKDEIPRVLNGLGIAVISTSKGLMTDKQARNENVGGEVVCAIW